MNLSREGGRFMLCKDAMTLKVESIGHEAKVMEAAQLMQRLNIGVLPVVDHQRLVGVVTDRDITIRAVASGKSPKEVTVGETMTPNLVICYEEQQLDEAAQLMKDQQIRRLLVVNRNKELVGMLSLTDLADSKSNDHLTRQTLQGLSRKRQRQRENEKRI